MPTTVTLGSFVLSAVLLLVAILGGKFKMFGAEVTGEAGKGGRLFAGGLGLLLLLISLVGLEGEEGTAEAASPETEKGKEAEKADQPAADPAQADPAPTAQAKAVVLRSGAPRGDQSGSIQQAQLRDVEQEQLRDVEQEPAAPVAPVHEQIEYEDGHQEIQVEGAEPNGGE
jgi:hypothetical protein